MTMHFMPLQRRLVAFVFPLLVVIMAGASTPGFVEAGLPLWPLFIFALPALLSLIICSDYWNAAIGFSQGHMHFRSVGYDIVAPMQKVTERQSAGKVVLSVSDCEPRYSWWLAPMQAVLGVLMPGRSRYAHGLMATVPLYSFSTAPNDAVMKAYRQAADLSAGALSHAQPEPRHDPSI